MIRGTIVEHDPSSHIDIIVVGGERRRIEAARVAWAGPAAEMPSPPAAGAVATAAPTLGTVPVHFEADREDVRVYALAGHDRELQISGTPSGWITSRVVSHRIWDPLCSAPCTMQMVPNVYVLGVGSGDSTDIHRMSPVLDAARPLHVAIRWQDRSTFRIIGALVWSIVGGLGTIGAVTGLAGCIGGCWDGAQELAITSAIAVGASTITGLVMVFLGDSIELEQRF